MLLNLKRLQRLQRLQRLEGLEGLERIARIARIANVLAAVKKEAAKNEVKFSGDASGGTFAGDAIAGNYSVDGQDITIVVTKSPAWVPDLVIKSKIVDWFKGK